ncbi:MAG: class I SAM-dependent methyltransferase [Planctomycetota bacterium]
MKGDRKQAIRAHYEPRLRSELASHAVLDWRSREGQLARIRALCRNVDLAGRRVLDLGCGLGDLYAHLTACGIGCDYTGVDLLEEMVVAARRRHAGARFLCADVFEGDVFEPAAFDVVFASGVFNLDLGNNEAFLAAAIPRLRRLARECVVFNLLHRRCPEREPGYCYYDPGRVAAMLREGGCRVELLDGYLPGDFTVLCRTGPAARRGSCEACALAPCEVHPC